ncbi:uncharacterized protein HD556DRAFT_1445406 [Suillus plorans]|uniref:JmjC domain-containing protein n=1 Tax=Suillus plorans TaxID=116603 RepID=A0A9P7DFB0_9AGAM|nr:uncharacterized protein HD556DRAFT_1445406 [Suillus plorans]KAG1791151.1 hypothetical protein HD556DRAFT_1445406 [Suillus plorans]
MPQHDQPDKKPRLQHADLSESNLTEQEKQRERQRRWLANEKRDPARAQEIKERNAANKRAWRKRKKEEKEKADQTGNAGPAEGQGPAKKQRVSSPETHAEAGPSNSAPDDIPINPILLNQEETLPQAGPSNSGPDHIPIDPLLLNQEIAAPTPTLPLMRDAEVMTDAPEPFVNLPVETIPVPSSPTFSTLTNLDSRDRATPIIGTQVHEKSDTIDWSDGSTTVLPCIMRDGVNICQEDADTVAFFASLPESLPETSKNVVHLHYKDWRTKSRQLCDEISAAIRVNKAVVIRNISTPEPATLDLDYLEDRGMSDLMHVVIHDAEQRTKDFTFPHQHATLEEFVNNIHDPNKIQCILDVGYGQGGLPSALSTLDSGIVNGWNQTTVDCPVGEKVHPDNFTVHSWALIHSPAFWTHPHHDSDGSLTFVQVETGEKKWGLWRHVHEDMLTRTHLSEIAPELTDLYQNRKKIQETWHGEIVTLLPGDMLIQPPGQFHAVYTPVTSFATGGHFYNYETMHLTELSRYIDHKQGRTLTNQVHEHSLETFQRMVINLPRISRRIKLYSRPLIALCIMVFDCNKYVAAGTEKPKFKTNTTKPAHDIANAIIKNFWKDLKNATSVYRKKQIHGSNSQTHPGEPISRDELLNCLKRFTAL